MIPVLRFVLAVALLVVTGTGCGTTPAARSPAPFTRTHRVEYRHGVDAKSGAEVFTVDRVVDEGPWAGLPFARSNGAELGLYRCDVLSRATGALLYSVGFCSIFGEWRTTADAKEHPERLFEESIRIPAQAEPATIRFLRRDPENRFAPVAEATLPAATPESPAVLSIETIPILEQGALADHVDLLFLGDGYAATEREKFVSDVKRLSSSLLDREPYRTNRAAFNVRAVFSPSHDSGISLAEDGQEKDTALGCRYSTFGLARYVLTLEDRRWRRIAASAPYDALIILLNAKPYGGGGVFDLYCVAAADSSAAEYLVAHEFGHSFAALGDEYYTSPVAYENYAAKSVEPWEPNVTALLDAKRLKWGDLASASTPLPTPWRKQEFETLIESLASLRESLVKDGVPQDSIASRVDASRRARLEAIFDGSRVVGAYEGALYERTGLYRPEIDCIMFRRDCGRYCAVCARAVADRTLGLIGRRAIDSQ